MPQTAVNLRPDRSRYFVFGTARRFFAPALISAFWLAVAGVVDSVFVGSAVGHEGLAAISFGMPVYLFYNILSYGFSIGGSIRCAAKLAEGREEEANRIFSTILRLLFITYVVTAWLGVLFLPQLTTLLGADPGDTVTQSYVRTQLMFVPVMFLQGPFYYFVNTDNGPETAAAALTLSGIADTAFSYVFIVRMGLGVVGSVYSTVVGAVLMLLISGSHLVRKRGALRLRWTAWDFRSVGLSARTGFATSLGYLYEFIVMIAMNRILMRMSGPVAVAAFDVVYNISMLCDSVSSGAAVAIEPMLSSYRSERNIGNIRTTLTLAMQWSGLFSLVFAAILAIWAPEACGLFGMTEGLAYAYTVAGIRIFALSVIPKQINTVFCGYYQSILREGYSYLITLLRSFLFYLLALFLCARGGMDSFWYLFVVSEVLTLMVWVPQACLHGGLMQLESIDTSRVESIVIDSAADLGAEVERIQSFCSRSLDDERLVMYIGLTIEEICTAVVGHFPDRMGEIYIQVTVVADEGDCTLYLRDNANEFNPLGADTSGIDLAAGERLELMGVHIVQKKAKEFYYRHYTGFNTLVIRL